MKHFVKLVVGATALVDIAGMCAALRENDLLGRHLRRASRNVDLLV